MKKLSKLVKFLIILGVVGFIWTSLTFVVEKKGKAKIDTIGESTAPQKALIVYDPDPFYDFDEQICKSVAKGLASAGWLSKVSTVTATADLETENFNLYIFCANTYNWNPDKVISQYIKTHKNLKNKRVVAITLGSGSTKRSQRILEQIITKKEAKLISSKAFWLLKPNGESNTDESNVTTAIEMAYTLGAQTAQSLQNKNEIISGN